MTNLSNEEITTKAGELSQRENCKVHPLVFMADEKEQVVGYVKEPVRLVKQRALDAAIQKGATVAAGELLEAILIKDASDSRIYNEAPEFDKFYLGASMACMELIKISQDQFKKK
jgi:hypothetical protein